LPPFFVFIGNFSLVLPFIEAPFMGKVGVRPS
jgi:hypothetical protein